MILGSRLTPQEINYTVTYPCHMDLSFQLLSAISQDLWRKMKMSVCSVYVSLHGDTPFTTLERGAFWMLRRTREEHEPCVVG